MTFGRGRYLRSRSDSTKFACFLKTGHNAATSRQFLPESACAYALCQRAQGRPGAGWHPRSTVRRLRYKRLHSGIQVKPHTRPSLRSGLTAYAELSPGSDALLPPSPCGWLMQMPGRAATSPQDLTHRPRRQDDTVLPYANSIGRVRDAFAHGFPPGEALRANVTSVHRSSSHVS